MERAIGTDMNNMTITEYESLSDLERHLLDTRYDARYQRIDLPFISDDVWAALARENGEPADLATPGMMRWTASVHITAEYRLRAHWVVPVEETDRDDLSDVDWGYWFSHYQIVDC